MILGFRVQFNYKRPNAFILSKNLISALVNTGIINKKLAKDLENH